MIFESISQKKLSLSEFFCIIATLKSPWESKYGQYYADLPKFYHFENFVR